MAKTYNNLLDQICTFENVLKAFYQTRKGKRDRREYKEFERNRESNLLSILRELREGTYEVGVYRTFEVFEPKAREISALPFRDRVVQHAIMNILEPIFDKGFIFDSYACRKGKGTHAGADQAQRFIRIVQRNHGQVYVLKSDVCKYFHSIPHDILKRQLRRKVSCPQTLALLDVIIDSMIVDSLITGVGIHVGSLLSQLMANVYLDALDQHVKHSLREVHYVRYMDDVVFVHSDKKHLHRVKTELVSFLAQDLRLRTDRRTQVFRVARSRGRGLDFLGYKIWATHRRLRKCSIGRIKKMMKKMQRQYQEGNITLKEIKQRISSWVAHASHAQTYGLRTLILSTPFTR